MQSNEVLYRIKVGDWRVIYTIMDDVLLVLVVEIGPRQGAYRDF
jgi:mRNA interferase RelE/StbE